MRNRSKQGWRVDSDRQFFARFLRELAFFLIACGLFLGLFAIPFVNFLR